MSGINKVILIGHLGADPESRDINGKVATKFSLATSDSWTDKNTGQRKEKTEWHNIKLWGKLAETAQTYLKKGHKVYLEGHLETQKWQDKTTGYDKFRTEIVLNGYSDRVHLLEKKDTQEVPGGGVQPVSQGRLHARGTARDLPTQTGADRRSQRR